MDPIAQTVAGFLDPADAVSTFGLHAGDHVADFGAGHGYFTIPIARTVGNDGKVYAIDIQRSVLDVIRAKARIERLFNIEPIWGNIEEPRGSHLKDGFLDLVVTSNIFFQVEDKTAIFNEAYRILRSTGKLIIIEWLGGGEFGPPANLRVSKETLTNHGAKTGFTLVRELSLGSHHYGLEFKK